MRKKPTMNSTVSSRHSIMCGSTLKGARPYQKHFARERRLTVSTRPLRVDGREDGGWRMGDGGWRFLLAAWCVCLYHVSSRIRDGAPSSGLLEMLHYNSLVHIRYGRPSPRVGFMDPLLVTAVNMLSVYDTLLATVRPALPLPPGLCQGFVHGLTTTSRKITLSLLARTLRWYIPPCSPTHMLLQDMPLRRW